MELIADPIDEQDPAYSDTRAVIAEGLEQAERGEGRPVREVFAEWAPGMEFRVELTPRSEQDLNKLSGASGAEPLS